MKSLTNKKVLLGVTGGIAAYKSAELLRRLQDAGAHVRVVMTEGATEFVTPLTFQALSGYPVGTTEPDADQDNAMEHINLARWADIVIIAPTTANFLAKLAHGLADDLLSTLCLSSEVPLVVAPSMNQAMWSNSATQVNLQSLRKRGVHILGPGIGAQACGEVGLGRMLEPEQLLPLIANLFVSGRLAGLRVMVTAGPTREMIDPVRFISNCSSGKMGYAVAIAAMEAGASVTLVSGPVALPAPDGVKLVFVESAAEMYSAVMSNINDIDVFIAAAAVADYKPRDTAVQKIKKSSGPMELALEPTQDIVASVAALDSAPFTVGFAAETENLEENAKAKQQRKSLDMVAANIVGVAGTGFESDDNALQLFWKGGETVLARMPKDRLARQLIEAIAEGYRTINKPTNKGASAHAESTTQDS